MTGECEPTSLKVRVKELVNDEEMELMDKDDLPPETIKQPQQLFDCPIPPAETYHIYNPRLLKELNEILRAMRLTKWQSKDLETYRDPSPKEVSESIQISKPRRSSSNRSKSTP